MDTKLIEEQLNRIPEIIKKLFFSTETAADIAKIGEDNGLLLDQINDLIEETGYMIIGLKPSKDFVDIISKKLKIDSKIARKISTEINDDVLADVKEEIRRLNDGETESKPEFESVIPTPPANLPIVPDNKKIEEAGQFTIEKTIPISTSPQYKDENINKEDVLKSIEDKPMIPVKPVASPMIDHLLTAHVNAPEKIEVKEVKAAIPEKKVEEKKSYTADPYREQI
ncbi:MAG: hypothetical protein QG640_54 [Patescibacteria group bacterium]|nr:hypothetical protein [Patescibacteria group bacterium]